MNDTLSMILAEKGSSVYTVRPETTVFEAVGEMNRKRVGAMVVLNNHKLVGIFTERDVLTRVISEELNPKTTPVARVMTTQPITLGPEATVDDTMETIRVNRARHIPIVKDNKLLGMVSIGDIVRWVSRMHEVEAENLKAYISGSYV